MAKVADSPSSTNYNGRSLAVDLNPTIMYNGANYVFQPPTCSDICYSQLTCGCKPFFTFRAAGDKKLTYINQCIGWCPWTVRQNGELVGSIRRATVCDNGLLYFCFKMCICKEVMMVKFHDKDDQIAATMRIYDGLLRKCCGGAGEAASAALSCFTICLDCAAFCQNKNTIVISEDVFSADMDDKQPIGQIHEVKVLEYIPGIGVIRKTIRQSVKFSSEAPNQDMVAVTSMLPMMQNGLMSNGNPCAGTYTLIPPATGSAFDCGRRVQFRRMNFADMLTETEITTGGAPAEAQDDLTPRGLLPEGLTLKSQEELLAMPNKPHFLLGNIVVSANEMDR